MTNTIQNPINSTSRHYTRWPLYSLKDSTELEKLDREADHEYVPMDVFVDPRTMMEHFQESSIRARLIELYAAAA